jgi:hypothetical protein
VVQAWTPDSRRAFPVERGGSATSSAGAEHREVTRHQQSQHPIPDSRFTRWPAADLHRGILQTGIDVMTLELERHSRRSPLVQSPSRANGIVSPDGRWLAYETSDSGQFEIYARPFPTSTAAGKFY